jgi:hypothetical protein
VTNFQLRWEPFVLQVLCFCCLVLSRVNTLYEITNIQTKVTGQFARKSETGQKYRLDTKGNVTNKIFL